DAILRTSYGVRFLERAYDMFTCFQLRQNASSCCWTSCRAVVFARKSYVAGKRKPSGFVHRRGVKQGTTTTRVARSYCRSPSATGLPFFRSAMPATTRTRRAICARVKPSGKMIRNGFGGGGRTVVVGA